MSQPVSGAYELGPIAAMRASEAWENRRRHGEASRMWAAMSREYPDKAALYTILAKLMAAYEDADAEAEIAFNALASTESEVAR